jgi:hypothetical protein
VPRYFEGFAFPLWMRRYRCPDCGGVHTLRPDAFWARFRYSARTILDAFRHKMRRGVFDPALSRKAQQYWWRGFRLQASRIRNRSPDPAVLGELLRGGFVPASHVLA